MDQLSAVSRIRHALVCARDCVMESFDYVTDKDGQMLADARLAELDAAVAEIDAFMRAKLDIIGRGHIEGH